MKPEIKQLWCQALRSGEFKPTKGNLKDKNGFDPLGVLCVLYQLETGMKALFKYTTQLPEEVQMWAGLNTPFPKLYDSINDIFQSIAVFNDGFRWMNGDKFLPLTFEEISVLIEQGL